MDDNKKKKISKNKNNLNIYFKNIVASESQYVSYFSGVGNVSTQPELKLRLYTFFINKEWPLTVWGRISAYSVVFACTNKGWDPRCINNAI